MRIHSVTFSPNCRKIEALIHHFDLPVEIVPLDMAKPITRTEAFKKLNPNGKIPCLEEQDWSLWESNVILTYLAELHELPVLPQPLRPRTEVHKWLSWQSSHLGPAIGKLFNKDDKVAEQGRQELDRFLPVLEGQLQQTTHVAGESLTVADFAIGAYIDCVPADRYDFSPYEKVTQYMERLRSLKGFDATRPTPPG